MIAESDVRVIDIRPLKYLEALLASGSKLCNLIHGGNVPLRVVEVDRTLVSSISVHRMPSLEKLSVQESNITLIDVRDCLKL